jgi:hypothetical protein
VSVGGCAGVRGEEHNALSEIEAERGGFRRARFAGVMIL